ncbi:Ppx/GppA family phosphatase [Streptomyces yaizuensis]|uniref:Ppx/GppA family phosphatase n=2 Tax=Streptomyces yaizuensis TaxID=2989713 RepID=A0ABQ5NRC4_9ACTN|nr:Ppx/GppA family phosphatase [Streptomyces sp. YSPA8]
MAVLDVGSNTVRLMIADMGGALPLPLHTAKHRLRLADGLGPGGELPPGHVDRLADAVTDARTQAEFQGADTLLAFATAIVRDAPNRRQVVREVARRTGVLLHTLDGETEAELTFLAARRWMGWRAGPLAMLDIGGGSLDVAFGRTRLPDFAASLPLGAHVLTREFFGESDPPPRAARKALRRYVRHRLRDVAARIRWEGPATTVATSRTFQQLGRLCGAPAGRHGPFVPRVLDLADLRPAVRRLRGLTAAERAGLPGISPARAGQSLAGALVAHTAMGLMGIERLTICPWGLREGMLLRCIEEGGAVWWPPAARHGETTDGHEGPGDADEPRIRPVPVLAAVDAVG